MQVNYLHASGLRKMANSSVLNSTIRRLSGGQGRPDVGLFGERAMAAVADHELAERHGARVGDPVDDASVGGNGQPARGKAAVPGRKHANGGICVPGTPFWMV